MPSPLGPGRKEFCSGPRKKPSKVGRKFLGRAKILRLFHSPKPAEVYPPGLQEQDELQDDWLDRPGPGRTKG